MEPNELKKGHVYFSCGWSTAKYPVPDIRTFVYIGENIEEDLDKTQNEYTFEIPKKYFEKEILNGLSEEERTEYEGPEEPNRTIVPEDCLAVIKDIDGLIDFLTRSKKEPNAEDIF
ncbi:MAG: hypothetical protein HZB62_13420 [Nitrospirae bacterium]|nr:hypothetical protein [Nitrospirota bacterium]